ncbi:hypothetical protein [Burkholderia sp. IMCC1007]|uniref:hypothetical protein n=1 Tax=Burkholderia sp. IMCC1007 TaxID=3004104 RepID=UPI0022B5AC38|nr:hypothetical protein [Burkholderia sp. IMCC1007]
MMFATLGVLGIGLALVWFTVCRNRTTGRATSGTAAEDDHAHASRPGFAEWRALPIQRNTIAMMLGSAGVIYMIWLYVSWLPAFTAAAAAAHTPALAVAAISGALFSIYFANVGTWAIVGVMVPSRLVATMGSVLTFGGYLGGSAAPVVTGVIADRTHAFANGLLISACLAIAAAAVFAFGIRIDDRALTSSAVGRAQRRPQTGARCRNALRSKPLVDRERHPCDAGSPPTRAEARALHSRATDHAGFLHKSLSV